MSNLKRDIEKYIKLIEDRSRIRKLICLAVEEDTPKHIKSIRSIFSRVLNCGEEDIVVKRSFLGADSNFPRLESFTISFDVYRHKGDEIHSYQICPSYSLNVLEHENEAYREEQVRKLKPFYDGSLFNKILKVEEQIEKLQEEKRKLQAKQMRQQLCPGSQ